MFENEQLQQFTTALWTNKSDVTMFGFNVTKYWLTSQVIKGSPTTTTFWINLFHLLAYSAVREHHERILLSRWTIMMQTAFWREVTSEKVTINYNLKPQNKLLWCDLIIDWTLSFESKYLYKSKYIYYSTTPLPH